jgi:hypothetical protein
MTSLAGEDGSYPPLTVFAEVRRIRVTCALAVLAGVLTIWLGAAEASIPAASTDGGVALPLWRALTMIAGTLPALGMHSSLRNLETVATDCHRRMENRYLFALFLGVAALQVSAAAMALDTSVVWTIARSLPAWFGVALIAGVCFGWPLSWILPVGAFGLLTYWGVAGDGYVWWEFSARPADDFPSTVVSVCLFGAGLLCYLTTGLARWSRKPVTRWVRT